MTPSLARPVTRLLPEPELPTSRITGESARERLLGIVQRYIAAEDAEAAANAVEMETLAAEMERGAVEREMSSLGPRLLPPPSAAPLPNPPAAASAPPAPPPPPAASKYYLAPADSEPWKSYVNPDGPIR
jgi:hypothetical protein